MSMCLAGLVLNEMINRDKSLFETFCNLRKDIWKAVDKQIKTKTLFFIWDLIGLQLKYLYQIIYGYFIVMSKRLNVSKSYCLWKYN